MEKEQVAVDEAVETVAEQNTRAYSKTVWNESTPITADKLNKIENGIADASRDAANCLPLTGGTLTGNLRIEGNSKALTMGTGPTDVFISNSSSGAFLQLKDDGLLRYNNNLVYHEGFKPSPWDIGALPLAGGTLTGSIEVPGESRFYNGTYVDPWHGKECSIKASGHVGIGGSLKVNENLSFSNFGTGGRLNANIHNLALQNATGNGQMITAANDNRIYVGNPNTALTLESNSNPEINVGGSRYHMYHTGNKPTAWDIGAMSSNGPSFSGNMIQAGAGGRDWIYHINADAGTLHIAPHSNGNNDWDHQISFDRSGQIFCNGRKKVPTWDGNPTHYMFRYGSGLGGANGYITFSY